MEIPEVIKPSDFKRIIRTKLIVFGLLAGKNYTELANQLKISRGHLHELMKKPEYQEYMRYWLKRINEELESVNLTSQK